MLFMKLTLILSILATAAVASFTSCSDDDRGVRSPDEFDEALAHRFPQAHHVEWENKGPYRVAEFKVGAVETEAWYTADVHWVMTVRELGKNASALPVPVAGALAASEYASWHIDDIDYYERVTDTFYVIDVEKSSLTDTELFFTPDGALIKAVPDRDSEVRPNTPL